MAAKKKEEWINSKTAADILTKNSGHPVSDAYARRLGNKNLLTTKAIDGRTKLFLLSDVESYIVKPRGTGEVRRALRGKKADTVAPDTQEASWWQKPDHSKDTQWPDNAPESLLNAKEGNMSADPLDYHQETAYNGLM